MKQITPQQRRKLVAAAKIVEHGDLAVIAKIVEFEDILDDTTQEITGLATSSKEALSSLATFKEELTNEIISRVEYIADEAGAQGNDGYSPVKGIDYLTEGELTEISSTILEKATPKKGIHYTDGQDYILTYDDKKEIAEMIDVPVVDRIIEIKEIIKEVSKDDSFVIKDIKKEIEDIKGIALANSLPATTSFFNGLRAKNLVITGTTASQKGDTVTVVLPAAGTGTVNSIVAGTGISVNSTDPANPIVTATGSSSGFQVPLSGAVDGNNKTYTWTTAPNALLVDGVGIQKTNNGTSPVDTTANWSGTTTTVLLVAPTYSICAIA